MEKMVNWLHLSDLHVGQPGHGGLTQNFNEQFQTSLTELHGRCGPWDLILFTGDLAFSGQRVEYEQVDAFLTTLKGTLKDLDPQSNPLVLAVPGNHDLSRPKQDTASNRKGLRDLKRWFEDPDEREACLTDRGNLGYRLISDAFSEYSAWWKRQPQPAMYQDGLLPGDFSIVVEIRGIRLGIVGLNTAFLHLDDQAEGKLALDVQQFHAACGGNGAQWTAACDLCLLLTHHPPSWLHPSAPLKSEIAIPKRFSAHLYGHLHTAATNLQHRSGETGTYLAQSHSLFGMDIFKIQQGSDIQRDHGYMAGRLAVSDSALKANLTIWPRVAKRQPGGSLLLRPDFDHFSLQDQTTATEPIEVPLHADGPLSKKARSLSLKGDSPKERLSEQQPVPPSNSPMSPVPPGGPYIPKWYVERPHEEATARRYLATAGTPVVLFGPALHGKRTLMHRLLDVCQHEAQRQRRQLRTIEISFENFDADSLQSLDRLLHELAVRMVGSLNHATADHGLERVWARPGSPINKINILMEQHVLRELEPEAQLILAMDNTETLIGRSYADDFFGALRGWSQRSSTHPWGQLRLILAMSTRPMLTNQSHFQSPFANIIAEIQVVGFSAAQVAHLIYRYGLPWTDSDRDQLMDWIGGHPYLIRQVLYLAVSHQISSVAKTRTLPELVDSLNRILSTQFRPLSAELRQELSSLARGAPNRISSEQLERLREGGILVDTNGSVHFRYPIYRDYFTHLRSTTDEHKKLTVSTSGS